MRAFHSAGLLGVGLCVLAGAACMLGNGRAVAQSDLELPADPPVLSKPYRSSVPIFRRRPPPDAVPPDAAGSWREPPGRVGARDGAPQAVAPEPAREEPREGAAALREAPADSGFGPVKPAPSPARDLAPDEDPEERPAAPPRPVRAAAPAKEPHRETRAAPRAEHEAPAREAPHQAEADEEEVAPAYAGVWGPSAAACASRRSARRGFLPAVIRPASARAGTTLCQFRETRREGRSWTTTAACRSAGRRWTSRVRLTVAGNRLTWTSERGAASYTRCSGG